MTSKHQLGFTLIELVIYIALVGVIVVSLSLLALEILGGQSKNFARQEVVQNMRFITTDVKRTMARASAISSISTSTVTVEIPNEDDVTFSFNSNTFTKTIGTGSPIILHSDEVWVTGLFEDLSVSNRTQHLGVTINIVFNAAQSLPDFTASSTAMFTTELRGRK